MFPCVDHEACVKSRRNIILIFPDRRGFVVLESTLARSGHTRVWSLDLRLQIVSHFLCRQKIINRTTTLVLWVTN